MANVRRLVEAAQRHLDPQISADLDEAERRMVNGLRHLRDEVSDTITSEQYLYPALRLHLAAGDSIADHEIEEHAEAEETS